MLFVGSVCSERKLAREIFDVGEILEVFIDTSIFCS